MLVLIFCILSKPMSLYCLCHFVLFFSVQKVRSIKQLPVNVKSITESLSSVLLHHQKSMFSQNMYLFFILSSKYVLIFLASARADKMLFKII
jgi:hypothetical protein